MDYQLEDGLDIMDNEQVSTISIEDYDLNRFIVVAIIEGQVITRLLYKSTVRRWIRCGRLISTGIQNPMSASAIWEVYRHRLQAKKLAA